MSPSEAAVSACGSVGGAVHLAAFQSAYLEARPQAFVCQCRHRFGFVRILLAGIQPRCGAEGAIAVRVELTGFCSLTLIGSGIWRQRYDVCYVLFVTGQESEYVVVERVLFDGGDGGHEGQQHIMYAIFAASH